MRRKRGSMTWTSTSWRRRARTGRWRCVPRPDDREAYLAGVEAVRQEIIKGNLLQGVLSRRVQVRTDLPAIEAYRALRSLNPSPYMFYLDFQDFQLFGASPEVHVKAKDGRAMIRPLAGTRRRGQSAEEDKALEKELLADEKERAEHLMLVDLARNDLGRVCEPGSVEVPEFMEVERYSHVMHIVSQVEGRLRGGHDRAGCAARHVPRGHGLGRPEDPGRRGHRFAGA